MVNKYKGIILLIRRKQKFAIDDQVTGFEPNIDVMRKPERTKNLKWLETFKKEEETLTIQIYNNFFTLSVVPYVCLLNI